MNDKNNDPLMEAATQYGMEKLRGVSIQIRNNMFNSVNGNPDQFAQNKRLANATGIPLPTVQNMPSIANQQYAVDKLNAEDLAKNYPKTASFLSDPDSMSVSHDDIENLKSIEFYGKRAQSPQSKEAITPATPGSVDSTLTKYLKKGGSAFASSLPQANAGLWGVAQSGADLLSDFIGKPLAGNVLPEDPFARLSGGIADLRKMQQGLADRMMPAGAGPIESGVYSGLQSTGQTLLTIPAAILTGQPGFTLGTMAATTGGQSYAKAKDAGKNTTESLLYGASDAVVEAGTEGFSLGPLLSGLKAGSPFVKLMLSNQIKEQLGEQSATALQDLNEWAVMNPEKSFGDYLKARPDAAIQTAVATVVGSGAQVTILKAAQVAATKAGLMQTQAQQADATASQLTDLNHMAETSKLRPRDPEAFKAFISQAMEDGPVNDLYLSAESLSQSGVNVEELAKLSPSFAEQVSLAAEIGGDIRIPIDEFMTTIGGTELAQSLIPHLRTDPNALSQAQAQEQMKSAGESMQKEVERVLSEHADDNTFNASRDAVAANFQQQFDAAARFTPDVNKAYAGMAASFYSVAAAKVGITPEQLAAQFPLRVQAESLVGDQTLSQVSGGVSEVAKKWQESGIKAGIYEGQDGITLSKIIVPNEGRGVGAGSKAMQQLIDYADSVGKRVMLSPSADFGGNKNRLVNFYKKFGFVENKGKNKDYSTTESMYREPAVNGQQDNAKLNQTKRGSITLSNDMRNQPTVITLLENADLSTALHEFGHFFLEVYNDLATQENAPAEIKNDLNAVFKWFGKDMDSAKWNAMNLEEKRDYHEQFARGFESYLFEGKSPNIEMRGVFSRFRSWLMNIYRSASNLNVQLSDEVRGVFDRMLASTETIKEAEAIGNLMPAFATAEEAGMTTEQFKAYHDLGMQATQDAISALETRSLRDLQWLDNAKSKALKKLQRDAADKRKAVRAEVESEVMAEPVNLARNFLKNGVIKNGPEEIKTEQGHKLSISALTEMYPPGALFGNQEWKKLGHGKYGMVANEGLHPDLVSQIFGYSSGDQLVHELLTEPKARDKIESLTDQRMLEKYGDINSPESLAAAVDQSVYNDARTKFINTEANAFSKAVGAPSLIASAAKQFAADLISRVRIRDLKPSQYSNAEARAAKESANARKKGDIAEAARQKRNQSIQNYATRAAISAREEIDKTLRYLKKFSKESIRSNLPADYVNQIDMLLDKYDLRDQSLKQVDRTKALRSWVLGRIRLGESPAISEALLSAPERAAFDAEVQSRNDEGDLIYADDDSRLVLLADAIERSAKRSYKEMTVEEFSGLRDTIKQIEHLGRLKDKLMTAREGQTYAETRDLLVNTIVENAKYSGKNVRTDNTWIGSKLQGLKQFGISHIKPAIQMQVFDGRKVNGPWWSTIVRPANERASFESTKRAVATNELMRILGPVLKNVSAMDKIGKGRFFPEIGTSLNWEERFAIACQYGNEGNLQRLMGGGIGGVSLALDINQVHAVLRTLSEQEWLAVQGVWDHFESYRPEIAAKELRVSGVEPDWVTPRQFSVKTSDGKTITLKGGYYPVVYDSRTNLKAQQHNDAQAAKDAMKASYSAATTQRSFTKSRVEEVKGRPLLLNLSGLYSGVNDVIHDLAWHEWVIDVNRLLRSKSIDEAIREHYGPEFKKELTKWRDDIVAGTKRLDHGIENAVGWARKFVSSSAMTFNVMSAIRQPIGIGQSMMLIGIAPVCRGIAQYISNPVAATVMVKEKSEFMNNRTRTMFRDLNELRNRVAGQTTARELMGRYGYFMTMHCQMMADVPTWIGAYEKATLEGHDDATSISLADQAVKNSQGGGEDVDLAGITRGGPMVKLFTAFYDFMNTQANAFYLKGATSSSKADAFMSFAMIGVAVPLLTAAITDAITPGDSGDWDDWESILKKLLSESLSNLVGMVAFGREFTQVAKALYGDDRGMGYSGPAGLRIISDSYKLAKQINQGEMDDAFRKSFVSVLGDVSGIPSVQINKSTNGAQALQEGKTDNPAALLFGYQTPHK